MPATAHAPEDVVALFAAALHEGDVDDALSLFESDAVFVAQPDGPPLTGHDAIRDALTQFTAMKPTMTSHIHKVVSTGDVATVLNTWRLKGSTPSGELIDMAGTSADVMRRRADGTWAILIDDPWGAFQPATPS
ncbi:MAG: YybH family protein [Actinomycetes bacterium]